MLEKSGASGRPQCRTIADRLIQGSDKQVTIALEKSLDVLAVDGRNIYHDWAGAQTAAPASGYHVLEALADFGWQNHFVLVHLSQLI
jgi:hypothetical protein